MSQLPRRGGPRYVTDGGMETDLIFHHGVDLPDFAAFPLLEHEHGRGLLRDYYAGYAAVAAEAEAGLLLESPTWRANPDWGARLGYDATALDRVNREAIGFLRGLAEDYETRVPCVLVNGMIGPRGDGYAVGERVDPAEAERYHRGQVASFAAAGADLVTAYTLTDPEEAVGVVAAARTHGVAVAVSFTVETDGRLPSGMAFADAVRHVEERGGADHYLVNCAHPLHVMAGLPAQDGAGPLPGWEKVIGIRANASRLSHAELDEATALDEGDLAQFVAAHQRLDGAVGGFTIVGGCCGTNVRHVAALWGQPAA